MAGESSSTTRGLKETPTWVVAGVCAVIIIISIALEKILHKLGKMHVTWLLWYEHRILAAGSNEPKCNKDKVPLITVDGLHRLHILIFFLAVFHIVYSLVTMALGRLKIRRWKQWEQETLSHHNEFFHDPSRFRLAHETSFVRAHIGLWTKIPFFFYIGCFFRQFFWSVSRSDYLTLRNGFINVHLAPGSKFDFRKYIKRSLEDDFKTIVGVNPILWASFVIYLLLNVNGWRTLFWASLIPPLIILAVGTKLQAILTAMALEITDRHALVQGIPLVQASNQYFWFGWPPLVLHLIHFALFQNAFQITYFLWIWYKFGLNSCFHNNFELEIAKISLRVVVLFICSYITLPLYALVAQMGSHMKKSIFDEQTSKALENWKMAARKRHEKEGKSPARTLSRGGGGSLTTSSMNSTLQSTGATLHRFMTTGHSTYKTSNYETDPSSPTSPTTYLSVKVDDHDDAETETSAPHAGWESRNESDFSFVKPTPLK